MSIYAVELIGERALYLSISEDEASVVHIAADMFAQDMELVCGRKPLRSSTISGTTIVAGTVGVNPLLNELADQELISLKELKNEWEAFIIKVIPYNGRSLIVVAGSDKRGTAYGILELSRMIGVSPWIKAFCWIS